MLLPGGGGVRREDRLREFMVVGVWYTVPEIESATGIEKGDVRRALNSLKRFGMAEQGEIRDDGSRCREWRLIGESEVQVQEVRCNLYIV